MEEEFLISGPQGDSVKADFQEEAWIFATHKLIVPDTTGKKEPSGCCGPCELGPNPKTNKEV